MKSFTPRPRSSNARVFVSLFTSFLILVTPVMPAAAAAARSAGYAKPKLSSKDIRPIDSTVVRPGEAVSPPSAIINATKTDSFPDPNMDGKAEPGDTITYDVNVSNSGAVDATGVSFTDTIDSNTTLVPGSLKVSPLAFADSYNATKDVALIIGAPGVLANDTGTPAPSAQPITAGATTAGGSVTLNADGSFTYNPPAGFTGADSFTYTATNGLSPDDTATVTLNVDQGPSVTTTTPANGATNVAMNSNITVNFSEPVNATTNSFSVQCPTGSPQSFTLSASPAASFTLDPVADLPAGTTCTVTVFANQITDADTFDPPDQMAADYAFSFGVKPLAVDDMHSATGNVRINTTGSGFSVLTNDQGPGVTISAFDSTSAHGGNVTMNTSTGTFTYDPPRGFTGTDSFNYTISNSAGSDQGTVVLTVSDMIWFINNSAGACSSGCDGRLTHPFTSLAAFEAINGNGTTASGVVIDPEAGDNIFIYTGSGNYTGPLTLENNQRVIGQGASSSIETLAVITLAPDSDALPSTGGTNPTITNPTDGGIILAQNNGIHGLTISNTSGTGLSGNNFGTLTVSENVILSNTTTAGTPVSLSNGVLAATFRSISAGNSNANPDPVNGIVLTNTTGSFTVSGDGSTTGGLLNRNGSGGTLSSLTGHAVLLTNANGVNLRQMNITNTAANFDGVNSTGGGNIKLSAVLLQSPGRHGWSATNITGASGVDNNSRVESWNALNSNGIVVNNTSTNFTSFTVDRSLFTTSATGADAFLFIAAGTTTGTVNVTSSEFTLIDQDAVQINNDGSGTLTAVVQKNNFHDANATSGNNTLYLTNDGSGQLNFTVGGPNASDGNTFTNLARLGTLAGVVQVDAATSNKVGTKLNGSIQNNVISNSTGRRGIDVQVESNASTQGGHVIHIENNTVNAVAKQGVNVIMTSVSGGDSLGNNITIKGNQLGTTSPVGTDGGDSGTAIEVETAMDAANTGGDISANVLIQNNVGVNNNSSGIGDTLEVNNRSVGAGNSSSLSVTVLGNSFTNNNASGSVFEVRNVNPAGAATNTICLDMNADNVPANANSFTGGTLGFRLTEDAGAGNFSIDGMSAGAQTSAAVASFLSPRNNNLTVTANGSFVGAPLGCALPTASYRPETNRQDSLAAADSLLQNGAEDSPLAYFKAAARSADEYQGSAAQAEIESAHAGATRKARAGGATFAAPAATTAQPLPSGETVNATIGTLPAGKSVHIQFQVTVNSPLPGSVTQVSNQGTVSGDNFANVLTDDPAAGGSADPTVTPILTPPDISIRDASVGEPASGSTPAAFAVVLTHAFSQPVTVNFSTAPDTGGVNPATAGSDYTATSGTVTFNPGETIQTISVPVLADVDNSETSETFLVNLSGASGGTIVDGQAVGTITPNGTPGTVVISELRTSGPAGPDDDFVELLNNTDTDITVQASDSSTGWALVKSGGACSDTPVVVGIIPNGAVIPARGNYLLVGSAYSLAGYAAGDQTLTAGIEDDRNVALFNTADVGNLQTGTRLDAVGFGANTGNNCDLLREGGTLQPAGGSTSEYSFVRKVDKGETKDTGDNSADFVVVSTTPSTPVGANTAPTLGAPGPENSSGPRGPVPCDAPGTAKFDRARLDSSVSVGSAPNTVRDNTSDPPNNSTKGTLDFRRRFTNNTGGSVTRLRFRIVDMSTTPSGAADLRARTSSAVVVTGVNDSATCNGSAPCSVTVQGTTLETPPLQALGGGVNSSLGAGTITLATPLNSGASVNLRFLFGVEQEGDYHIAIVIEALTGGSIGQDIWQLRGNTVTGGHTDGGCNTPPVADAGADQSVECAGASTSVTLDGTASSDPDGDTPLTYEWREGVTVLGTTATLNTSLAFGSHTITLKVTDPSGDFSEDTVTVNVVDTSDPMITAPPNVTAYTGPGATSCGVVVSDATLGTATASDGCSATVNVTRTGVPSGNVFPVGQTMITYTADDGHGHTKDAYQTVTIIDNTPPTLSVPPDQTVNAPANSCSANVDPGTATGGDNCPGVTVTGTRSDNQPLNAPYPVGTTTITWTAKDTANNMTTGTQTITVNDATPPVIVLTSGALILGPPNHSYQTFNIAALVASASDQCDASVDINDVVISQVTSDEVEDANGNGDGNTLHDIVIAPDCKSVQLRRERNGNGDGRVYKITLKVKDSSGNVTTAVRQVIVPNSGSSATDSGVNYTVNGCNP